MEPELAQAKPAAGHRRRAVGVRLVVATAALIAGALMYGLGLIGMSTSEQAGRECATVGGWFVAVGAVMLGIEYIRSINFPAFVRAVRKYFEI
jgi:hypothetical protein